MTQLTPVRPPLPSLGGRPINALRLTLVGLTSLACGDSSSTLVTQDAPTVSSARPTNTPESNEPAGETPGAESPLYLTAAMVSAGDLDETYLVLTRTFDETTEIEPTSGVSVVGAVVPIVHAGSVYLTEGNAPVVSRYDVGQGDRLVKRAELSFAGAGVAEVASWYVYIHSDTQGYVFDQGGQRLIEWNPSTMTLTGVEIDLSATHRDGWAANLVLEQSGVQRRGDNLFIPLSWLDQDFNYRFATGLVVLDTSTNRLVTVEEDTRCGEPYNAIEAPNGDLYFFPSAESSLQHFYVEEHQPTCVLRVPAGATTFADPLDLSTLGSGAAAAGAVPDGSSGFFFSSVDPGMWEARGDESEAFWKLWHYDFATGLSDTMTAMPTWAGTTYHVEVDGQTYLPHLVETEQGPLTTLYRLDGGATPEPLFSFNASWYGFARLR